MPLHRELIAAPNILVAMEVEPYRRYREEQHHRDELGSISEEHREVGNGAEKKQYERRQRMERMDISAFDRIEGPLLTEHDHIEGHIRVPEQARQDRE